MNLLTDRVLITGANGWLGKALVKSLVYGLKNSEEFKNPQKKLNIRCLLLPGENSNFLKKQSDSIEIMHGNLTSREDCDNFMINYRESLLIHCAGIIHPNRTKEFYDINVSGTNNLLKSAIKNKIKKVIIISSNSPCGTNPDNDHLFDEKYRYNPYLHYGKSKMIMEKLAIDYINSGNIKGTIIRPPWFYGPFQPERQKQFYKMIINGTVPVVGSGENKRSMACTLNICQGIFRSAITEKSNGKIYWIADENPYTFNQIIRTIKNVFENEFGIMCKNNMFRLPNLISGVAYYTDKIIQNMGYYNKKLHVLSEMNKTIACSIGHAKKELQYRPDFDLYEGTYLSIKPIIEEFRS